MREIQLLFSDDLKDFFENRALNSEEILLFSSAIELLRSNEILNNFNLTAFIKKINIRHNKQKSKSFLSSFLPRISREYEKKYSKQLVLDVDSFMVFVAILNNDRRKIYCQIKDCDIPFEICLFNKNYVFRMYREDFEISIIGILKQSDLYIVIQDLASYFNSYNNYNEHESYRQLEISCPSLSKLGLRFNYSPAHFLKQQTLDRIFSLNDFPIQFNKEKIEESYSTLVRLPIPNSLDLLDTLENIFSNRLNPIALNREEVLLLVLSLGMKSKILINFQNIGNILIKKTCNELFLIKIKLSNSIAHGFLSISSLYKALQVIDFHFCNNTLEFIDFCDEQIRFSDLGNYLALLGLDFS